MATIVFTSVLFIASNSSADGAYGEPTEITIAPRMRYTWTPSLKEWISMPRKIGKDRNILHNAVKTDADIIVSSDKKFKRYADGYKGIAIMKPSDYVSSREDNKNNKRQKK